MSPYVSLSISMRNKLDSYGIAKCQVESYQLWLDNDYTSETTKVSLVCIWNGQPFEQNVSCNFCGMWSREILWFCVRWSILKHQKLLNIECVSNQINEYSSFCGLNSCIKMQTLLREIVCKGITERWTKNKNPVNLLR